MTYADLTGAVLALSGGLEPGPEPVSTWGNADKTDPVPRLFRSHGAAAAFAAALTRTLAEVARRLPETAAFYIMPPVIAATMPGERRLTNALTWDVPAVRGVSCRVAGRGTVTLGASSVHVARDDLSPLRLIDAGGTLTFAPDAGQTLTVFDVTLFADPGQSADRLPLLCGQKMLYDLTAFCPRFALPLHVAKPARVTADVLLLPREHRLPVAVRVALFPPVVTADEVLQNGGACRVPVPDAAARLLALGVASDLYAAEPDLPVATWRERFAAGVDALTRPETVEEIFDKRGWV